MIKTVLAIETSCDDTSVAIVEDLPNKKGWVHAVLSASQDLAHSPFGGIVPEIACRNHSIHLLPLIEEIFNKTQKNWDEIDGIAVTSRPGLIGALIVGLVTAKSFSQSKKIPFLGINHLEGHILAPFLRDLDYQPPSSFDFPFIALAVSGGHTSLYLVKELGHYEILGSTLDDAAGEAFDKFGKSLGLGWPGGVKIDKLSGEGNFRAYDFPRGMIKESNYLMSFSGLKAAGQRLIDSMSEEDIKKNLPHLCASYQEAIVEVLLTKLNRAVREINIKKVIITGGVSANSRLRTASQEWADKNKVQLLIPPLRYCTDNAAMIGYAGLLRMQRGEKSDLSLAPSPNSWTTDFKN